MRMSEAMRRTGSAARATGGAVRSGGGGDAFVAVSLAGTIFFSTSADQARGRVVLFLLVTMAPFAVLAPFIGPALDRMRQGRRYLLAGPLLARGLLCFAMAAAINKPVMLLPAAFGILVLQKAYGVARASITPRLLPAEITLVTANARSQLVALTASMLAGSLAAGIEVLGGAAWVLGAGTVIYLAGMILALRLPDQVDAPLAPAVKPPSAPASPAGAARPAGSRGPGGTIPYEPAAWPDGTIPYEPDGTIPYGSGWTT